MDRSRPRPRSRLSQILHAHGVQLAHAAEPMSLEDEHRRLCHVLCQLLPDTYGEKGRPLGFGNQNGLQLRQRRVRCIWVRVHAEKSTSSYVSMSWRWCRMRQTVSVSSS